MKKNDTVTLEIEDFSAEGYGIGHCEGFALFVKDTVIGDVAEVKVVKMKKTYGYGRLMRILTPSPDRIEAPCPVARPCGGCQIQQMRYEAQLRFKEQKVKNNLQRIGGFEELPMEPILGMTAEEPQAQEPQARELQVQEPQARELQEREPQAQDSLAQKLQVRDPSESASVSACPIRFRNKAQFPISRDKDGALIAGFFAERSHRVIDCRDCLIGAKVNRQILDIVLAHMEKYSIDPYDETTGEGLVRHVVIRVSREQLGHTPGDEAGSPAAGCKTAVQTPCAAAEAGSAQKGSKEAPEVGSAAAEGCAEGEDRVGGQADVGQIMVCLVINGTSLPAAQELVDALCEIPDMASITLNLNRARTNVILGERLWLLWGKEYIEDTIGGIRFRISPLSFYQVNPVQTEKLYGKALEYAALTGSETVWDLYCGIGTISLFLARHASSVYGVEIVPEAVDDARINAKINGITNVEFYVGKAEEILPQKYREEGIRADVIVVDPPRKGCEKSLLDTMLAIGPKRIVYVSCDSATLARDLRVLTDGGYEIRKICPVDMFGHSVHVETVVQLVKRKPTQHIDILMTPTSRICERE